MSEFEIFFDNEFFIIDSNNLSSIQTNLYGFLIDGKKIIRNENIEELDSLTNEGVYVYVEVDDDNISIYQDSAGCYGLYYYESNDYFAISNSFLKLVEYLKHNHYLSLNDDYAKYIIASSLTSEIFSDTLVNEIETIPRNRIIHINKKYNLVFFEKIDFKEHTIELDSIKGLKILDKWFFKWMNIIRYLKSKTNNIQFDLSGGFDSRIVITLLLASNVDLNKIEIRSYNDDESCHSDDFRIANEIADAFNFKLNNKVISAEKINFNDITTPLQISFYTKLGFHNQFNYKFHKTKEEVYNFSGFSGEKLRGSGLNHLSPIGLINHAGELSKKFDPSFEDPARRIHETTINKLCDELELERGSQEVMNHISLETRFRNHFGKTAVEEFFSNKLMLIPCDDPLINSLKINSERCDDKNLLITLIYMRYCPKLLNIPFEGNRKIDEKTIEYAKQINDMLPFKIINNEFISGPEIDLIGVNNYYPTTSNIITCESDGEYIKWGDVDNYLKTIFNSNSFKNDFKKYFPEHVHSIIQDTFGKEYYPLECAFPAFSIIKIINDVEFSQANNTLKLKNWLNCFEKNSHFVNRAIPKIIKYDLFDEEYYVNQFNQDLVIDPLEHYLYQGYKLNLNPSKKFDANYYLNKNRHVSKSGLNPLVHYVLFGIYQNVNTCPDLNYTDISSRCLSKNEFDNLVKEDKYYENNWNNFNDVIELISKMDNVHNILEVGPHKCPLVKWEDVIDITDVNVNKYPIDINNFIKHDCSKVPFPIKDKQYDLVIMKSVLQFLGMDGEQINVFDEIERISKRAIITLPYKWFIPQLRNHHMIDEKMINHWSNGRRPSYKSINGNTILLIYDFE